MVGPKASFASRRTILGSFGTTLLIAALVEGYIDQESFTERWITFWLWAIGLITAAGALLYSPDVATRTKGSVRFLLTPDLLILFVVATLSRFAFLSTYPFYTTGDEIRDGGLRGSEIASGALLNIFGYDWSQGLFSATLCSFAYRVFGPSVLTYRVPAAILSVSTILIIATLGARLIGRRAALMAAIAMTFNWSDLHYARIEPLIVLSQILVVPLVLAGCSFASRPAPSTAALLGLLVGFAFNLHATVKPVALVACCVGGIGAVWTLWKRGASFGRGALVVVQSLLAGGVFTLLAFGPRILFTTEEMLFNSNRIVPSTVIPLWESYIRSVRILFDVSPIHKFGSAEHVLIPSIVVRGLLVVGFCRALFARKLTAAALVFGVLLLPLTNSALTENPLADHRMVPAVTFGLLLAGFGLDGIMQMVRQHTSRVVGTLAIVGLWCAYTIVASLQLIGYFTVEPSSARFNEREVNYHYWVMHLVESVKDPKNGLQGQQICISGASPLIEPLGLAHFQELFAFFLPGVVVNTEILTDSANETDQFNIQPGLCSAATRERPKMMKLPCEEPHPFTCPKTGGKVAITIY